MKRILCAVFFIIIFTLAVNAESFTLSENDTINGNIVKTESHISSDGTITGDGIFFCQTLDLKGNVGQDLLGAFSTSSINAKIGGNLRAVAGGIFLSGEISKNVTVAAGRISLEESSLINGSSYIIAGEITLDGEIKSTSYIAGREIYINGTVDGDLYVYTGANGKLYVNESAKINGTLYVNGNQAFISPRAEINKTIKKEIQSVNNNILMHILSFAVSFVILALLAIPYYLITKKKSCTFPKFKSIISFLWKFILYLLISILFLILLLILSFIILPFRIFLAVFFVFTGSLFFLYLFSVFPVSRLLGKLIIRKENYFTMLLGFFIIFFVMSLLYLGTTIDIFSITSFIFIYTICILICLLGAPMLLKHFKNNSE